MLARSFIERSAARLGRSVPLLSADAQHALRSHTWPGNVRELQNCLERAVTLAAGQTIRASDLALPGSPPRCFFPEPHLPSPATTTASLPSLNELVSRYIHDVLRRVNGNKTAAAKLLGINRRTLHRKLRDDAGTDSAAPSALK